MNRFNNKASSILGYSVIQIRRRINDDEEKESKEKDEKEDVEKQENEPVVKHVG